MEALWNLRYPGSERTLWVDALSINQGSYHEAKQEKAQQIQLMKYIYSIASATLVWMANPPEDLSHFILTSLADGQSCEDALREDPEDSIGHMNNILLLSWWRRTWVIQEAVLAKDAILYFGQISLPLQHLLTEFRNFQQYLDQSSPIRKSEAYKIFVLLMEETVNVFTRLLGSFSGLAASHRQALALAQMGHHESDVISNRPKPFHDFVRVLAVCRYSETSDPRDKIWGLLGLTSDVVAQKLDPTYELSVAKIYTQTTRDLIDGTNTLFVLSQCYPSESSISGLPSWVPD